MKERTKPTRAMSLRAAKKVALRDVGASEAWLQDTIVNDPALLGLGDLVLVERERSQPRAGRLDLLFSDPDSNTRFEVELMLGATDPSHIFRVLEYWDIERRRYPGYDHVAVLIAEDITARYLNVLGLFAGTIPLVAIQLNALQLDDGSLVLDPVIVLDQRALRTDDTEETGGKETSRTDWESRVGKKILGVCDALLGEINKAAKTQCNLNYKLSYIGLERGGRPNNFIYFRPKKSFVHVRVRLKSPKQWASQCDDAGLVARADESKSRIQVTIKPNEFSKHHEILKKLISESVAEEEAE